MTTPPALLERVLALALKHPPYGCKKLNAPLMAQGKRLSNVTIEKILIEHRLDSRYGR